jgi:GT2 family glycosyltransferase
MHNSGPEISVIILSYNTKDITLRCLEKLKKSVDYFGKPVEIIVVEDGTDGTSMAIKKEFPWIKILDPGRNLGFAKGNNLGIEASDKNSKYYLFLNSDTLVREDTLKKAYEFIENHNDCDVFGCKLKFENGKMQPSAGFLPTPLNTSLWMLGLDIISSTPVHPKSDGFFVKDRKVGWVMGAFLFMKKEVIEKTKGFDENFFMYMEEVEWCRRINDASLTIWYTPSLEVTHLDKASSDFNLEKPLTLEIQGLRYYIKKYFPNSYPFIKFITRLGVTLRFMAFGLSGDKKRSDIYKKILQSI